MYAIRSYYATGSFDAQRPSVAPLDSGYRWYVAWQQLNTQLICLHCLARQEPMNLSRLAREVSLGPSTTDGIVDRLEAIV